MAEQKSVFERSFDLGEDCPRFIGLTRERAEMAARAEGLRQMRTVELPTSGPVVWHDDLRRDRVNFIIEQGRVVRAAIF
jgi:hypothetical protein